MGFASWYMGLFEKKPKKEVAKGTAPVHEAWSGTVYGDVSFDSRGTYSVNLGEGYTIVMHKDSTPGFVDIRVSGPGIENHRFVFHMKRVFPDLSRGNNNMYSQRVFHAKVSLKNPVNDLNRLRRVALSYIEQCRETRKKWDEV